jgi:hypothetical protein
VNRNWLPRDERNPSDIYNLCSSATWEYSSVVLAFFIIIMIQPLSRLANYFSYKSAVRKALSGINVKRDSK